MYDLYKPFRNYLRHFPLLESLEIIWAYSEHIAHGMALPRQLQFQNEYRLPIDLKKSIYLWELDLLCGEIVLNASATGDKSLGNWRDLSGAINHIRRIENDVAGHRDLDRTIMRELHRIVHRQFPWQRPPSVNSMMRYLKIFGRGNMNAIVERETGLTMKKFFTLGLAAAGHFMKKPGLNTNQNYTDFGITADESEAFYARLTTTSYELKEATKKQQHYDTSWAYVFNPLAARPLVSFNANHPERVICPIPIYLLRRVTDGIFYDIAGKDGFENAFGFSFQEYVGEVLRRVCPPPRFTLIAEEEYRVGKYRKDGVDWVLEDETANLFVECKTKRLRQDAKFMDQGSGLEAALDAMAGYVIQHYKNIQDAIDGKTVWKPNGLPILPIIITLEDWWLFNPAIIGALMSQVELRMKEAALDLKMLQAMPFTIASIDEFELAAQILAQTGIMPFIGKKADKSYREWAVSPFAMGNFPELHPPRVRR